MRAHSFSTSILSSSATPSAFTPSATPPAGVAVAAIACECSKKKDGASVQTHRHKYLPGA
eukprot:1079934-Rhodomonas_salina.3